MIVCAHARIRDLLWSETGVVPRRIEPRLLKACFVKQCFKFTRRIKMNEMVKKGDICFDEGFSKEEVRVL